MREGEGSYDVVIAGGVEHLFPVNDGVHDPAETCPCGPLVAHDRQGPLWFHRSIPAPL